MYSYVRYTQNPGVRDYLFAAGAFCGLLSKPTLVTFPFALLLFDFRPLHRLASPAAFRKAILEKLPLFALALVSYVTYLRQTLWPVDLGIFYAHP
jgi:hypothetical protein